MTLISDRPALKFLGIFACVSFGLFGVSGCSSSSSVSPQVSASVAPTATPASSPLRKAGLTVKDIRICVARGTNADAPDFVVGNGYLSKGSQSAFDSDSPADQRACFESESPAEGWVSTIYDFDDTSMTMLSQNPMLARPDVLLCPGEVGVYGLVCTGAYGKNTFSQGDTFTMDGKGHFFNVHRLNDQGHFIAFDVTVMR